MNPSPATRLAAAFTRFAAEGRDVAWLADEFLAAVAAARRVHLTRDPDPAADAVYCRIDGGPGGRPRPSSRTTSRSARCSPG